MNMQPRKVLESLEYLAEKLGVEIVYEKLGDEEFSVRGGLCKVQKTYKIFMTRSEPVDSQIKILARALSFFNTENIYLLPFIREILEMSRREEKGREL
ncbi:MAG: hypothetical protein FD151_562 [bacterium]|nr:MAG: hypothetical protein FD151_562 [bacterium]